jgi:hypothetical protein
MELTQKKAVTLQRRLWEDMQNRLGDNPGRDERYKFAEEWCKKHFPNEEIYLNCFLCEYDDAHGSECTRCPLAWLADKDESDEPQSCGFPYPENSREMYINAAPISKLLAVPERDFSIRVVGSWIDEGTKVKCGICGKRICKTDAEGKKIPLKFCPQCGAKMKRIQTKRRAAE